MTPDGADLGDQRRERPVVAERTVHTGRVFDLVSRTVDLGEAGTVTREYLRHPGAVAVVALDEAERVLMIRQYRVPVAAYLWEIPAGLLDGGAQETLLGAAQRELAEEADIAAARWDVLVDYATTPGGSDEVLRIFLARDLRPVTDSDFVREGEEAEIEVRWVPLAEAVAAVLAGRIHNPSAVAGLLAAERVLRTGSVPRPVAADWALRDSPRPA
ncbi:NUDIX domain-containing protein [Serinibacter salmoneus]|uniref:ADP-ribose pyrophosphatase n=1 Tax=Serinibacter salmoneus TaxID=556530 RepID=A0A2A9CYF2_9MICO|nr:NUDIX hydrolase [Serinibacter salmoneus]PFG19457.1 ADP-ribose pyrophosphatase [Serinibacter salmoneus]